MAGRGHSWHRASVLVALAALSCGRSNFDLVLRDSGRPDILRAPEPLDASLDTSLGSTDVVVTDLGNDIGNDLGADIGTAIDGSDAHTLDSANGDAPIQSADSATRSDLGSSTLTDARDVLDASDGAEAADARSQPDVEDATAPADASDGASLPCMPGDPCVVECAGGTLDNFCVCQIVGIPRPNGEPCRPQSGVCDRPDTCDGESLLCADDVVPAGTVCAQATGVCDPDDQCDGTSHDCPTTFAPNATPCNDGNVCSDPDWCVDGLCQGTATGDPCTDRCTYCIPRIGCSVRPTACIECIGNEGLSCGPSNTLTCTGGTCR